MKVALVVEGTSDKIIFDNLYEWFQSKSIELIVVQTNGKTKMLNRAEKHYKSCIFGKGADFVIFMLDNDNKQDPKSVKSKFQINFQNYYVHLNIQELEAWILADSVCMSDALSLTYQPSGLTDTIQHPKELLQSLCKKNFGELTEVELAYKVAGYFSLEKAAIHNNSAKKFIELIDSLVS